MLQTKFKLLCAVVSIGKIRGLEDEVLDTCVSEPLDAFQAQVLVNTMIESKADGNPYDLTTDDVIMLRDLRDWHLSPSNNPDNFQSSLNRLEAALDCCIADVDSMENGTRSPRYILGICYSVLMNKYKPS